MRGKKREARALHMPHFFGGSFRTAQRTDMRKKVSTRVFFLVTSLFFGGSFRTAQRTDIMKKKRSTCASHTSLFSAGLVELHNVLRKKRGGGARIFLHFNT